MTSYGCTYVYICVCVTSAKQIDDICKFWLPTSFGSLNQITKTTIEALKCTVTGRRRHTQGWQHKEKKQQ